MDLPKRKPTRLKDYDYSSAGKYFITICTQDKKNLFCQNVGANCVRPQDILFTDIGNIVCAEIENCKNKYDNVDIDKYIVMPNHIHLIIAIYSDENGRTQFAPTISRMVKQFKGIISKEVGFSIWQKSFHDHIIRNEADYLKIWNYIDTNPQKWNEDCFYVDEAEL